MAEWQIPLSVSFWIAMSFASALWDSLSVTWDSLTVNWDDIGGSGGWYDAHALSISTALSLIWYSRLTSEFSTTGGFAWETPAGQSGFTNNAQTWHSQNAANWVSSNEDTFYT